MADTPYPSPKKGFSWARFGGKFLVVSVLLHVFFLGGATYLVVQRNQAKRKLTFKAGPPTPPEAPVEHKVQLQKEQQTSAPQMAKRITTTGMGKISLPEMPDMPTQSDDIKPMKMSNPGQGLGMGTSMLSGAGNGVGSISLPSIMADRCSPEGRAKSIRENGGDPKDDEAILKALRWLKAHQNPDGSWGHVYLGGMTGLGLLSFLGHCERPNVGEFGPAVKNGLDRLITAGTKDNGYLSINGGGNGMVYQRAISTYAMGEAYIITKDERMPPIFKKAIGLIVKGQRPDGGWSYNFAQPTAVDPNSDTSVTCWMIQALKTAHYSGLNIEGVDAALDNSMKDLLRVQGDNGVFGYRNPGVAGNLTGAGVYCLLMWHHSKDRAVRDGIRVIKEGAIPKRGAKKAPMPVYQYGDKTANLYAWYYNTQACFQAGGGTWDWWNQHFQRQLLDNQSADGSWPPTGSAAAGFNWTGTGDIIDAQVYRTCMCVLMLKVYYRYLSNSVADGASNSPHDTASLMKAKFTSLTPELYDYVRGHASRAGNPILARLRAETETLGEISQMLISEEQGNFMSILVAAIGAKSAIEVGTFTGFSSTCIARALPEDGRLLCVDQSAEWTSIARRYWKESGVDSKIELRLGNGPDVLRQLGSEQFDFAFIDADKTGYDTYFELILPRMRDDGLLIFDNMLSGGRVVDPNTSNENSRAIRALNEKLARDPRVESVLLSVADGLNICRKKSAG